jgi:superfamily II DNA or RNA helicase
MHQQRAYQDRGLADIRAAFAHGHRSVLYVLPTGGGKTEIARRVISGAMEKRRAVIMAAHRNELVVQPSLRLASFGIPHRVVGAKKTVKRITELHVRRFGRSFVDETSSIAVASVQSLARRLDRETPPDLVVFDEAHHAAAGTWRKIVDAWPGTKILGLTATPCRVDGKGLADVFDVLVLGPSYSELIDGGYLTDCVVYAPDPPDLSEVGKAGGDWRTADLQGVMDRASITGDVVAHYKRLAYGKTAVAFCVSVSHAEHLAQAFTDAGVPAAALSGKMTDDERERVVRDLAEGRLMVLTSCDVVSEGFDLAAISGLDVQIDVAILCRPTQSLALFLQQCGRAFRPGDGKAFAIVIDHAGNIFRHGWPTQDREWTLDAGAPTAQSAATEGPAFTVRRCPECLRVHRPRSACPDCGHVYTSGDRMPELRDGTLKELKREERRREKEARKARAAEWKERRKQAHSIAELAEIARELGYDNPWGTAYGFAEWKKSIGQPLPRTI